MRCSAAVKLSVRALAFLLLLSLPASVAHAGGTDTTTDTGATTSTGTEGADDTGTSTDDDGGSSSTTEGTCMICPPNTNTGDIVFSNLGDGNFPPGETTFDVYAETKCRCEDCVCMDYDATQLRLELNGDAVGEPCDGSQCSFTVTLEPGLHDLTAIARYDFGESSTAVQVLVPGEGTSSETGTPMQETTDEGCGCRSDRAPTAGATMALALVGMLVRRRGRRR